mmetsp:Transcript_39522/g.92370  ORF Transcript_39522/g.92370 Transcript_39522/m.92370 type:complete len:594 (+) Transcript_39522:115-1896(+)
MSDDFPIPMIIEFNKGSCVSEKNNDSLDIDAFFHIEENEGCNNKDCDVVDNLPSESTNDATFEIIGDVTFRTSGDPTSHVTTSDLSLSSLNENGCSFVIASDAEGSKYFSASLDESALRRLKLEKDEKDEKAEKMEKTRNAEEAEKADGPAVDEPGIENSKETGNSFVDSAVVSVHEQLTAFFNAVFNIPFGIKKQEGESSECDQKLHKSKKEEFNCKFNTTTPSDSVLDADFKDPENDEQDLDKSEGKFPKMEKKLGANSVVDSSELGDDDPDTGCKFFDSFIISMLQTKKSEGKSDKMEAQVTELRYVDSEEFGSDSEEFGTNHLGHACKLDQLENIFVDTFFNSMRNMGKFQERPRKNKHERRSHYAKSRHDRTYRSVLDSFLKTKISTDMRTDDYSDEERECRGFRHRDLHSRRDLDLSSISMNSTGSNGFVSTIVDMLREKSPRYQQRTSILSAGDWLFPDDLDYSSQSIEDSSDISRVGSIVIANVACYRRKCLTPRAEKRENRGAKVKRSSGRDGPAHRRASSFEEEVCAEKEDEGGRESKCKDSEPKINITFTKKKNTFSNKMHVALVKQNFKLKKIKNPVHIYL